MPAIVISPVVTQSALGTPVLTPGDTIIYVGGFQSPATGVPPVLTPETFLWLLEGDQQSGTDKLLLEGDQQSGSDHQLLEGIY